MKFQSHALTHVLGFQTQGGNESERVLEAGPQCKCLEVKEHEVRGTETLLLLKELWAVLVVVSQK